MHTPPQLLPPPQQIDMGAGAFSVPRTMPIVAAPDLLFEAQWLQGKLSTVGVRGHIMAAHMTDTAAIYLQVDQHTSNQAYTLTINDGGIHITGDRAGVFYGCCTLWQLLTVYGVTLPQLVVDDRPDFPARGVMLDISRDKVPTMDTLFMLVDDLAALKINQLQLYTEHTFAYQAHPVVWQHASPMTAQQILELDVYCRQRHIDLVPNQNSLGHMERWLKHPAYRYMAEAPDGFEPPWGGWRDASTLNPLLTETVDFMRGLYDELLPNFSSGLFNVGCDEPWELGQGASKEAVAAQGGRVYLAWLQQLQRLTDEHGRVMQFWGDIIMHHPELVPELGSELIALEWGYEANHPFDAHAKVYSDAGVPFYVCPGTSSWNSLIGRTTNALGNLRNAADNGRKHGAIGYLITDWGDRGHWQPLAISSLGFAAGAGVGWSSTSPTDVRVIPLLDQFVFRDSAGVMGRVAYELGEVYQHIGPPYINGQLLAYALRWARADFDQNIAYWEATGGDKADVRPETLRHVIHTLDALMARLLDADLQRKDAAPITADFEQAAALARHSARWMLYAQGEPDYTPRTLLTEFDTLLDRQREVWLARNRRGGLEDSMRRFAARRDAYLAELE